MTKFSVAGHLSGNFVWFYWDVVGWEVCLMREFCCFKE